MKSIHALRGLAGLLLLVLGIMPAAAHEEFPITVEHKFGSTTIEAAPERVVVIGFTEQDVLLALGVKPVAVRYWYGDENDAIFPWADDEAAAIEGDEPVVLHMDFGALNYEAILALDPDLIVAVYAGITEDEYATLSQIAPTLAPTADYIDFGMPWDATTLHIGKALGKHDEAEKLVADVQGQIAEAQEQLAGAAGQMVAVAYAFDGSYGFYTAGDPRGRFFTDLGFVVPDELLEVAGESYYAAISAETLGLLDQDLLVFVGLQFTTDGQAGIEADPLIAGLDVAKEERILFTPGEFDDALQFSTILSLPYLLDGLLPEIQAIVGGAAETAAVFPTTVEHKYGSTTIEAAPERVVAIGFREQDTLIALGVYPIAARYWYGDESNVLFPWAQAAAGDHIPQVLNMTFGSLNYEAILALAPDLISAVDAGITQDEYELLTQIAPTNAQSGEYAEFGMPWQVVTRMIAAGVGKSEEAEAKIAELDATVAGARAANPQFEGKTIAVVYSYSEGQYGFFTAADSRARFFTDLGFVVPDELVEIAGESFYADLSAETIQLLDQDVIVFVGIQSLGGQAMVESDPLMSQLNAIKDGRAVYLEQDVDDALQFSSLLSLPYALEGILPQLVAVVPPSGS